MGWSGERIETGLGKRGGQAGEKEGQLNQLLNLHNKVEAVWERVRGREGQRK